MDPAAIALIAIPVLYMLPWIVAKARSHGNSLAIFWLNVFVGWNVPGWIACLVWALLRQSKAENPLN